MSEPTLWPYATVEDGVSFGERCVVGTCAWIGRGTVMGNDCRIQHGAFIARGTQMGDRVFVGPNATTTDDRWPHVNNKSYTAEPPILEDDCNIGAGAIILPGVRIGKGATIGAGAVVTDDVAPFTVVVGCPAKELSYG